MSVALLVRLSAWSFPSESDSWLQHVQDRWSTEVWRIPNIMSRYCHSGYSVSLLIWHFSPCVVNRITFFFCVIQPCTSNHLLTLSEPGVLYCHSAQHQVFCSMCSGDAPNLFKSLELQSYSAPFSYFFLHKNRKSWQHYVIIKGKNT